MHDAAAIPLRSGASAPRIVQLLAAPGWFLELPEIDEESGARSTVKVRVLALALCEDATGATTVRPMTATGELSDCQYLINESDAAQMSKYQRKKRSQAIAHGGAGEGSDPDAPAPVPVWTPPQFDVPEEELAADEPVDPVSLAAARRMTSTLLAWVADLLAQHPDGIMRDVRSQLRWIDGVLEQGRRPTEAELGALRFDDPDLAAIDGALAAALRDLTEECREL